MSFLTVDPNLISIHLKWDSNFKGKSPEELYDAIIFPPSLFLLHRKIEEQYRKLPWPASLKNVTLMTQICGGRGDVATAAKVISFMHSMDSSLTFNWVLSKDNLDELSFLPSPTPTKLNKGYLNSPPEIPNDGGILIVGPAKCFWSTKYIESLLHTKISGPRFGFLENAEDPLEDEKAFIACLKARQETHNYRAIHSTLFPSKYGTTSSLGLPMGLQEGTGIFIDQSRVNAPRSYGHCCPRYLFEIEDVSLKEDILRSLNGELGEQAPDYEHHSLNSGYAHKSLSWSKFIDCVCIHEQKKNVIVVVNQCGIFEKYSVSEFKDKILTKDKLLFLQKCGYGTIILKGVNESQLLVKNTQANLRTLTIIIRPSFLPNDMKRLQLASERLLATGDNTAAEAWASLCTLYLYEDIANIGCKDRFLKQQIAIASKISPELGEFLSIGGKNDPLTIDEMEKMTSILQSSSFSHHTLEFCSHIIKHYSFSDVFEGAIKRTAWHYYIPELIDEEVASLDDSFKDSMLTHFGDFSSPEQKLTIHNLSILADRVHQRILTHIVDST